MCRLDPASAVRLVAFLAFVLPITTVARAQEAPEPQRHLVLFVTSGLSGHYANDEGTVAGLVATLRAEADAARRAGHDVAVLDAGRTLVPYAESRADEGATMARVLDALGCNAFVPAPMDLTLRLRQVARVASRLGSCPTVRAFDSDHPANDDLVSSARVDLDDPRASSKRPLALEIHSIFDPVFFGDLKALGVDAHRFSLDHLGSRLADDSLRILVAHSRGFGETLTDRELTWKAVREPHGFDLVIDPDLGHDLELERRAQATSADEEAGSVFLVGRALDTSTPWTYARIDVPLRWQPAGPDTSEAAGRWRPLDVELAVRAPDPSVTPDGALESELLAAFSAFRNVWDEDLVADAPTTREELVDFALDALRERAHAEIAVVNRGVLRPVAERYWTPPLTRETVLRLLTLDQQLEVGELTGQELVDLVKESTSRRKPGRPAPASTLRFEGLTWTNDDAGRPLPKSFRVNDRPLRLADPYRVVTNTFLTSGGDDYPILASLDGTRLEVDGRPVEARDDVVLPRLDGAARPLYDPSRRPLWRFGIEKLALDANSVSVDAEPGYAEVSDSRASASDASQAKVDLALFADQDWPLLRWENRFRVRYGVVETDVVEELTDDLRLEVAAVFQQGPWEKAEPYVAYVLDSEVRRNRGDDGERLPRQHEQSLAAGLSWTTELWPRLRLGVMARHQDDVEEANRLGVIGEAWFRKPGEGIRPGFEVDVLAERVDGDEATISRLDLDVRLIFDLPGGLALTPGVEYYVYDDSRLDGAAEYRGLVVGLRWAWLRKIQR